MATVTKPKIAPEILEELQTLTDREKQVIVHCCFPATASDDFLIRIWPTTYLLDEDSAHQSQLIYHENITLFPYWTEVPAMKDYWFTLVFSGLPKGCTSFELKEVIPQAGGFEVKNIKRNQSDIYRVCLV